MQFLRCVVVLLVVVILFVVCCSGSSSGSQNVLEAYPPIDPMDPALQARLYGTATIFPDERVVAGRYGTWTVSYRVGDTGIDDGGQIMVSLRSVSDWGSFQIDDPTGADYVTARTTGNAVLNLRISLWGKERPWGRSIVVTVREGYLEPGDEVIVTLGDRSAGGPGSRAQTIIDPRTTFKVFVDAFRTNHFVGLRHSPTLQVVPDEPISLVLVNQSIAAPGEPFWLLARTQDVWGNLVTDFTGEIFFDEAEKVEGLPKSYRFQPGDKGVRRFENLRVRDPGLVFIRARTTAPSLSAVGNPLLITAEAKQKIYWGDTQGQSEETVGSKSVEEYFWFAREAAGLDFFSHQGNDFQITPDFWERLRRLVRETSESGRFIAFLGYEWSANSALGGDHNVLYYGNQPTIHRSGHWLIPDKSQQSTDARHINALYQALDAQKVMLIPHIGGRRANTHYHQPRMERLIEIYSVWGYFPWFIDDVLQRGWKVGFAGASDDHRGQPGASSPGKEDFGVYGGLTAVFAPVLTRDHLWEALFNRSTYATTGQRILLWVDADGHAMGQEYVAKVPPRIRVRAIGTAGIERVEIKRLTEVVYTHWTDPVSPEPGRQIKVLWAGAKSRDRGKTLTWDGSLELTRGTIRQASPIALDSPIETVTLQSPHAVAWRSYTAGDFDGVLLDVKTQDGSVLEFHSPITNLEVPLASLTREPRVFRVREDLGQEITMYEYPKGKRPVEVAFEYEDTCLPPGTTPYYVIVYQEDGAMAWSSPIFVTRASQ